MIKVLKSTQWDSIERKNVTTWGVYRDNDAPASRVASGLNHRDAVALAATLAGVKVEA